MTPLSLSPLPPLRPATSSSPTPLAAPGLPLPTTPAPGGANPLAAGFESMLSETLQLEQTAQHNVEAALTGGDITQAEVLASIKKADLSLRLLIQLRNKTLAAYNELQQMRF